MRNADRPCGVVNLIALILITLPEEMGFFLFQYDERHNLIPMLAYSLGSHTLYKTSFFVEFPDYEEEFKRRDVNLIHKLRFIVTLVIVILAFLSDIPFSFWIFLALAQINFQPNKDNWFVIKRRLRLKVPKGQ